MHCAVELLEFSEAGNVSTKISGENHELTVRDSYLGVVGLGLHKPSPTCLRWDRGSPLLPWEWTNDLTVRAESTITPTRKAALSLVACRAMALSLPSRSVSDS